MRERSACSNRRYFRDSTWSDGLGLFQTKTAWCGGYDECKLEDSYSRNAEEVHEKSVVVMCASVFFGSCSLLVRLHSRRLLS